MRLQDADIGHVCSLTRWAEELPGRTRTGRSQRELPLWTRR